MTVDPMALAREWLPSNGAAERPQMTLSTVGSEGFPDARTVLLSSVTESGFTFNTDAGSQKVREIAVDPRVCLVIVLGYFSRQLVVQGTAAVQPGSAIAAAYERRSPYLKHLAWLNDAAFARLPLDERRARWSAATAADPDGPATASPTWTGFEVIPHRMVFWESAPDTASRRTEYRRAEVRSPGSDSSGPGWVADYLPG